jgi:hypothetical protein
MGIAILGAVLQTTMITNINPHIDNLSSLSPQSKEIVKEVINGKDFSFSDQKSQELLANKLKDQMMAEAKEAAAQSAPELTPRELSNPQVMAEIAKKQQEAQLAMVEKMKQAGQDVATAGKQGFVDSVNYTFRIAAVIALFGALSTLLFRNNSKIKAK